MIQTPHPGTKIWLLHESSMRLAKRGHYCMESVRDVTLGHLHLDHAENVGGTGELQENGRADLCVLRYIR